MDPNHAQTVELIRKRGEVKAKLTAFERVLNNFEADSNADVVLLDLQGRLARHTLLYNEFEEIQDKIEDALTDIEMQANHEERKNFENRYFTINGRVKKILNTPSTGKIREKPIQSTRSANIEGTGEFDITVNEENTTILETRVEDEDVPKATNQGNSQQFLLDPNLPKLKLPSFSGTYDAWLGFRDMFTSMVHLNPQVPTSFKFLYLKWRALHL
ncbi:unnamed protein product [Xylocopa violacea]|uniref:Uncharacterized protein n=1 Tax=Xylocopa violacea TaxID=135666 RepID=A0ABP1NBH6_XYLVO